MSEVLKSCIVVVAFSIASTTTAEVVLDGTLGFKGALQGPEFAIEASLGKQEGNNLFHSFDTFSLNRYETATFSGPSSIENIISRVTGGKISNIDGTLSSTMSHADFYLLNPAGIIFGQNARLDVQGSFYVSTANYLRLGNAGRFDASHPAQSLLTTAPPSAFGFLDTSPISISNDGGLLELREGKMLSFIGGDLNFQNGHVKVLDGHINLVSVASPGELLFPIDNFEFDVLKTFDKLGTIKIADTTAGSDNKNRWIANVDSSGAGGGQILLQGGRVILDNGYVFADTQGKENGQGIAVKATEELILKNGGRITTDTGVDNDKIPYRDTGNVGHINIMAGRISMAEGSQISSTSQSTGMAGNVTLSAEEEIQIAGHFPELIDNKILSSGVFSRTLYTGKGGNVSIYAPILNMESSVVYADTMGFNDAGNVSIEVDTLTLRDGAQINVNTGNWEQAATYGTGRGGNLTVKAEKHVLISGYDGKDKPSGLLSNVFTPGDGGTIEISSPLVEIRDEGTIQAGTQSSGNAGSILVNADRLHIDQGGFITSESKGLGNAGTIDITADDLTIDNGEITTQADRAGGGNIFFRGNNQIYLYDSLISAKAQGEQEEHKGGNLTFEQPRFMILNKSQLRADAYKGNGGNIRIIAENFIPSTDSILDASSKLGIDGEIQITAAEENFSNSLVVLTKNLADASSLLAKSCVESARDESHFVVADRIPDTDIKDVLKKPQPPTFKDRLPKAEILAIYQSLQKQLATTSTSQSEILAQLAALYAYEHRYPEALQLNKQALKALKLLNAPYWRYKLQWQRGRLFKALGEYQHAIIAYQAAIQKLATIRQHLTKIYRERYPNGERSEFREILKPIFTELVALLLELSELLQNDTTAKVLKTALQTMNQLKTAELQDYFQDDCTKSTIDLEQVDPRHTAIIYPIFLPNRVEVLVSLPQAQRFHKIVPATNKQLTQTINTLATQLDCQTKECRENHSYRASAQKLYDWLFRPIEPALSNDIHTLVFVPDGPLYSIPMAVLHDGKQFLIEKYAIAITPNLTITKPTTKHFSQKMLYSALTASNHLDFAPIQQYVTPMQNAFEKTFGAITTLKGRNFILSNLSQALHIPHTITHIFSHAQFSPQVSNTFIVTYNEKLSMNQLEQLIAPKQHSEVPLELLTLSACETAKGDERAALGLAGIAYKAGARSAVATLWSVRDDVVYHLFKNFYQALVEKQQQKAQAMRQAQLILLQEYPSWQHPHYWAAFLLIGHWL